MNCTVCKEPIPLARLQIAPQVKTCSPECSRANERVQGTLRQRRRRTAKQDRKA